MIYLSEIKVIYFCRSHRQEIFFIAEENANDGVPTPKIKEKKLLPQPKQTPKHKRQWNSIYLDLVCGIPTRYQYFLFHAVVGE